MDTLPMQPEHETDDDPTAGAKPGKMDWYGISHVGKKRSSNEDQFFIAELNKSMRVFQTSLGLDHQTRLFGESQGKLVLVADGMGGHEAGDRASTIAVDSIAKYTLNTLQWFFRLREDRSDEIQNELKAALRRCHEDINAEGAAIPQHRGMGTTVTMAYIVWPEMYVVHAGDSRCYLARQGRLEQITRDHTMQQLIKDSAGNTPGSGEVIPIDEPERWSHVLWNVVGGDQDQLTAEVYQVRLEIGDSVLLCSDGLTKHVADQQIASRLENGRSAQEICQQLVNEANDAGGSDNVTVAVARFLEQRVHVDQDEAVAAADTDPDLNVIGSDDTETPPPELACADDSEF